MEDDTKADINTAMDSPARDQVFSTPELAEMIFRELPPRHLLVTVQQVCRQWQAVVNGSTPIQQALFFKPIAPIYPRKIPQTKYRYYFEEFINPNANITCYHPIYIRLLRDLVLHRPLSPSFGHPDASWRRSLLSQPRLRSCEFLRRVADGSGDRKSETIEAPPGGFTLEFAIENLGEDFLDDGFLPKMQCQPASL
ncbi:hypothetical protein M409DRAFT_23276 [Zasmidium cellare ATCC 36951]|uniref:F-box domain-containing protein n=1 Tax=Zasmidium cellare ATCC 36951 TaxID=1080233 RepID=A0A6A6CHN4_ZASCE|nr:uncharacterized protein M409DRAFT_23276 [Zasmidium cellare ATCC 36951]KAF2166645.1 hypothetical protein M409DRAFT_23276 [Zasmidium cellare ATCC 36951]